MRRRRFLKVALAGAAILTQSPPWCAAQNRFQRCLPHHPDWPDPEEWASLARLLKGNLVRPRPLKPASSDRLVDLRNPFYLQEQPGAAQSQGWMDAWQFANSAYAVEAENTADIVEAVNFARRHRLRLVIRGGGHDYLGRSNAPDSLLIWTHRMRQTRYLSSFTPQGAPTQTGQSALMVSAGTRWLEAYSEAVTRHQRYVQGGGCTSVGAAGGFIQGGGFGSFSKRYGTAAAGLLQAELVTASGQTLTANAYQNQDLFWALKGGGGGTFGVVTRLYLKTHDLPSNFGLFQGRIQLKADQQYRQLILDFLTFYRDFINTPHWGEQIAFKADNSLEFYLVFQGLSGAQAEALWEPFLRQYSTEYQGQFWEIPSASLWDPDYWQTQHPGFITLDPRPGAPKGQFWWSGNHGEAFKYWYAYHSWWLPQRLLQAPHIARLSELLFQASRVGSISLHINKGLAGGSPQALEGLTETAVHPSAARAVGLLIMAAGSNEVVVGLPGQQPDLNYGQNKARDIRQAMQRFQEIAPEAGSYANEADYFQKDWQQAFWGENYPRLLEIKQKYDPDGLFYGHHNVGSEFWSRDGMTRT